MGKRGPIAGKPGTTGLSLVVNLAVPLVPPDPPAGLLEETLAAWVKYWEADVAQVATEVDVPALRRLFTYYDQHARAVATALEEPAVTGSTGQIKVNPFYDLALKLEAVILRLENELGLTPMSRMRLGIATGEAAASLDQMNRIFAAGKGADVQVTARPDPRLTAITTTAT